MALASLTLTSVFLVLLPLSCPAPVIRGQHHFSGGSVAFQFMEKEGSTWKLQVSILSGWTITQSPCGQPCDSSHVGQSTQAERNSLTSSRSDFFGSWYMEDRDVTDGVNKNVSGHVVAVNEAQQWTQEWASFFVFKIAEGADVQFRWNGSSWRDEDFVWLFSPVNSSPNGIPFILNTGLKDSRSRNDTGKPNSSPVAFFKAQYTAVIGQRNVWRLAVKDPDDDRVTCRVNLPGVNAGVGAGPGGSSPELEIVDEQVLQGCTLVFTPGTVSTHTGQQYKNGSYVIVSLELLDFLVQPIQYDGDSIVHRPDGMALSSVPVQFLIKLVSKDESPKFIDPTPAERSQFWVYVGSALKFPVLSKPAQQDQTITAFRVATVPPVDTPVVLDPPVKTSDGWSSTLTWSPGDELAGSYVIQITAVDSLGNEVDRFVAIAVKEFNFSLPQGNDLSVMETTADKPIPCPVLISCSFPVYVLNSGPGLAVDFSDGIVSGGKGALTAVVELPTPTSFRGLIGVMKAETRIDPIEALGRAIMFLTIEDNIASINIADSLIVISVDAKASCVKAPCLTTETGLCQADASLTRCQCRPGATGDHCDKDVNECASSPCLHGECHQSFGAFTCACHPHFTGTLCDTEITTTITAPTTTTSVTTSMAAATTTPSTSPADIPSSTPVSFVTIGVPTTTITATITGVTVTIPPFTTPVPTTSSPAPATTVTPTTTPATTQASTATTPITTETSTTTPDTTRASTTIPVTTNALTTTTTDTIQTSTMTMPTTTQALTTTPDTTQASTTTSDITQASTTATPDTTQASTTTPDTTQATTTTTPDTTQTSTMTMPTTTQALTTTPDTTQASTTTPDTTQTSTTTTPDTTQTSTTTMPSTTQALTTTTTPDTTQTSTTTTPSTTQALTTTTQDTTEALTTTQDTTEASTTTTTPDRAQTLTTTTPDTTQSSTTTAPDTTQTSTTSTPSTSQESTTTIPDTTQTSATTPSTTQALTSTTQDTTESSATTTTDTTQISTTTTTTDTTQTSTTTSTPDTTQAKTTITTDTTTTTPSTTQALTTSTSDITQTLTTPAPDTTTTTPGTTQTSTTVPLTTHASTTTTDTTQAPTTTPSTTYAQTTSRTPSTTETPTTTTTPDTTYTMTTATLAATHGTARTAGVTTTRSAAPWTSSTSIFVSKLAGSSSTAAAVLATSTTNNSSGGSVVPAAPITTKKNIGAQTTAKDSSGGSPATIGGATGGSAVVIAVSGLAAVYKFCRKSKVDLKENSNNNKPDFPRSPTKAWGTPIQSRREDIPSRVETALGF